MSNQDIPFALMRWIKRQQELEIAHRASIVKRNAQEDKEYMRYISFLIHSWSELKQREKEMVHNFTRWHSEAKNFSPSQRSAIASLYMKYCL